MALQLSSDRQHSAARQYDHQEDPAITRREAAEGVEAAANALLDDSTALRDIAACDLPFSMDSDWFTEATEALIKLDVKHPSDLMGSQLLTDLYRLAKTVRAAALEVAREKVEDAA